MRRWHQETHHMFRQWKIEMGKHDYDWRNPPTDPSACHCVTGIGHLRKRKAGDCGNPRCGICHWNKWGRKKRGTEKRKAIKYEIEAYN